MILSASHYDENLISIYWGWKNLLNGCKIIDNDMSLNLCEHHWISSSFKARDKTFCVQNLSTEHKICTIKSVPWHEIFPSLLLWLFFADSSLHVFCYTACFFQHKFTSSINYRQSSFHAYTSLIHSVAIISFSND